MKITLNSTETFKLINRKHRRVWEGVTEGGVRIEAYIDAIVVQNPGDSDLAEFSDLKPI